MTITTLTNDIVLKALYMLGEFSPQQPAPGYAIDEGISLLNDLLKTYMSEGSLIPYWTDIEFPLVAGQAIYTVKSDGTGDVQANKIQSLGYVNLVDFGFTNPTSYPIEIIGFNKLLDVEYSTNSQARPTKIVLQNKNEYSILQFYYVPDKSYTCKIKAKTQLDDLQYQDVINELPVEYQRFLRYALARELVAFYQTASWTATLEKEYTKMYSKLKNSSDRNLTVNPELFLTQASGFLTPNLGVNT